LPPSLMKADCAGKCANGSERFFSVATPRAEKKGANRDRSAPSDSTDKGSQPKLALTDVGRRD
jgi:hypothetical protein